MRQTRCPVSLSTQDLGGLAEEGFCAAAAKGRAASARRVRIWERIGELLLETAAASRVPPGPCVEARPAVLKLAESQGSYTRVSIRLGNTFCKGITRLRKTTRPARDDLRCRPRNVLGFGVVFSDSRTHCGIRRDRNRSSGFDAP